MPKLIPTILSAALATDLLPGSRYSLFRSKINSLSTYIFFSSFFPTAETGDATLMLLTVYLLPDRKGRERKVFQIHRSGHFRNEK